MAVNKTNYYFWQKPTALDKLRFRSTSPNLSLIKDYVMKRWDGVNLGTYSNRPIRAGGYPSTHSFGAAWDWRYPTDGVRDEVINWLIEHSEELGVQMIADYKNSRIWISKRSDGSAYWKPQPKDQYGMGQPWGNWLHIEITKDSWYNKLPIFVRFKKS